MGCGLNQAGVEQGLEGNPDLGPAFGRVRVRLFLQDGLVQCVFREPLPRGRELVEDEAGDGGEEKCFSRMGVETHPALVDTFPENAGQGVEEGVAGGVVNAGRGQMRLAGAQDRT